jgi:hypothetical protein
MPPERCARVQWVVRSLLAFGLAAQPGCGSETPGTAGSDAGAPPATDSGCPRGRCSLSCDPSDVALVFTAASAQNPALKDLGDVDPATPAEVGDGKHHLFAGVNDSSLLDGAAHGVVSSTTQSPIRPRARIC